MTLWMWTVWALAQEPATAEPPEVPAEAAPPPAAVPYRPEDTPAELQAWVPWLQARDPSRACARIGAEAHCRWAGPLDLDAGPDGATFTLDAWLDTPGPVPLPGGDDAWPESVRTERGPVAVVASSGRPVVHLPAGGHRLSGRFTWASRPQGLAVPDEIGVLRLTVDGARVATPRVDEGALWLGASGGPAQEADAAQIDVSRRLADGVPLVVETRLALRVSGAPRELDLGAVALAGTRPVGLTADVPARFNPDGHLVVQVRPGAWSVAFTALHDGPAASLAAPDLPEPWPDVEYWVFQADETVRAVQPEGPPAIDASRTTLPAEWFGLPTFAVEATTPLTLTELRRGRGDPPPDALTLQRDLWLDADGDGFTIRDTFRGPLARTWRLTTLAPLDLGHVVDHGDGRVVTVHDGRGGVELRQEAVDLVGESRVEGRPGALPAVGWDADVRSLDATLHLPPGWRLLHVGGVDADPLSILGRWTLLDLFLTLVVALAVARLEGRAWGALALAALALAAHEPLAPRWAWVLVVAALAVRRATADHRAARLAHLGLAALLAVLLARFAHAQLRDGLFPTLSGPGDGEGWMSMMATRSMDMEAAPAGYVEEGLSYRSMGAKSGGEAPQQKLRLANAVDPNAVVQTGPGLPRWTWNDFPLTWSGPVDRDHTVRIWLLSPAVNLMLAVARTVLAAALLLRLVGGSLPRPGRSAAGLAAALTLLLSPPARAEIPAALLDELDARLSAPPACGDDCVHAPQATLGAAPEQLRLEIELHAAADAAWALPVGAGAAWVPATLTLDGGPAALTRADDGTVWLRVPRGVHIAALSGPPPNVDALTLTFRDAPRRVVASATGWRVDGLKADGAIDGAIQLTRESDAQRPDAAEPAALTPWLRVHRQLVLGLTWQVRTEVERAGGNLAETLTLRVPLLPGEAIVDGGVEAQAGVAAVTLPPHAERVAWTSNLAEAAALRLEAPQGTPWVERWEVACEPLFSCTFDGPPPVAHVRDGAWSPSWWPWPGEALTIGVVRPPAAEGASATLDQVTYRVTPGWRQLAAQLTLQVRASKGTTRVLRLPDGAELQAVTSDGQARPLNLAADGTLSLPILPGASTWQIEWQQDHPASTFDRVPPLDLGGPAVNVDVEVAPHDGRWLVGLWGPAWGPVTRFWGEVLLLLLLSPLLARLPWAGLSARQWALLGLGTTQLPLPAFAVIAAWFVAVGWRAEARHHDRPVAFVFTQLSVLGLGAGALLCLYLAIHAGLLWQPEMQVGGNGSSDHLLRWFVDRHDGGPLPQPLVISTPLLVWRILNLLWALWLASSLVTWLPWAFQAFVAGGWAPHPTRPAPASEPPPT